MSADNYLRAKRIFQRALDLAPRQRAAYLDVTCDGDPALRREVEDLLRHHDDDSFLNDPPAGLGQADALVGRLLAHYEIRRRLGGGGGAVVYEAWDTRLRRTLAIKLLPRGSGSTESRRRLRREARVVAGLNHPNIVRVFSIEEAAGADFITMELISGRTLTHLLVPEGFELPTFAQFALPILQAVSAAHAAGVVHRDLKPENVMVSDEGLVKVLDFGLARHVATSPTSVAQPIQQSVQGALLEAVVVPQLVGELPPQADARPVELPVGTSHDERGRDLGPHPQRCDLGLCRHGGPRPDREHEGHESEAEDHESVAK